MTRKSILILAACFSVFLPVYSAHSQQTIRAQNGSIDLSTALNSDEIIALKGEWLFYPNTLASELTTPTTGPHTPIIAHVPKSWNDLTVLGKKFGGHGYGVYRLSIKLPAISRRLAVMMNEQGTAFSVYANGVLLGSRGSVGRTAETTLPDTRPLVVTTDTLKDTVTLDIEIANFHYRKGGMWNPIQIGDHRLVTQNKARSEAIEIFVAGTLIMIALYHFALYAYFRAGKNALIFAIFSMAMFLRLVSTGQRILPEYLPVFSFQVYSRIEYASWFFSIPLGVHYVHAMFANITKKWVIRTLYGIATVFTLGLVLPSNLYSYSVGPSNIILTPFLFYALWHLLRLYPQRPVGLRLFLFGSLVLTVFTINDILYVQEIVRITLLGPFGMLVFIFCQAILLSRHLLIVFKDREQLQQQLNVRLQDTITASSAELEKTREQSNISQQQFESVMHNIPGITYRAEAEAPWGMIFLSPEFERITGQAVTSFTGEHSNRILEIIHPDDLGDRDRMLDFANQRDPRFRMNYRLRTADGNEVWVEDRGQKIYDPLGNLMWMDGVMLDITLRKNLESVMLQTVEMAEAANLAKSQFLANMSHELRTPLHGVIGMVSLLHTTTLTPEQQEYLEVVEKSGSNLLTLINQILDLAKVESGNMDLDITPTDVPQLLIDACTPLRVQAEGKGLKFSLEIADNFPSPMETDATKFRQIALNLIGNAIKFTSLGSVKILLKPEIRGDKLLGMRMIVTDTGTGISPENAAHVFEPFRQADSSTSRKFGGTGLGLAITKQITERMGGSIHCHSTLSVGSEFTVTLPIRVERAESRDVVLEPVSNLAQTATTILTGARILLAEDDDVNKLIAERMLLKFGCEVIHAANGLEVLAKMHASQPDLILMDCMMPELDGYETTGRLRTESAYADYKYIPIIALSANAMKGDREKCERAGMNDFLAKPYRQEELVQKISQWLGTSS